MERIKLTIKLHFFSKKVYDFTKKSLILQRNTSIPSRTPPTYYMLFRLHFILLCFFVPFCASAQTPEELGFVGNTPVKQDTIFVKPVENPHEHYLPRDEKAVATTFVTPTPTLYVQPKTKHEWQLDLSVTAGTTGVGFELGMPINKYINVRAGGTFMPHFKVPMAFTAQIGDGDQMTADGLETRFERMAHLLEGFVGQPVDDKVDMVASPDMNQAKLMVDVSPFRNKNWHITAGLYCGKSRVATCVNKTHEITSLFAINLYNRIYDNNGEIALGFSLPPELLMTVLYYGRAGFPVGQYAHDVVYDEDVWVHDDYLDIDYIEHAKGDIIHAKGDTYLMAPSDENTAYANAFVNKFRPYFGFGYSGAISRDRNWKLGFDAGVMMWGGAPKLVDHSGIDFMHDLDNITGQINRYVKIAQVAKVFPVLEFKITRRLF